MPASTRPDPVPTDPVAVAVAVAEGEGHQCGRCRQWFADEPGTRGASPGDWWACPPCHEALFTGRTARSA